VPLPIFSKKEEKRKKKEKKKKEGKSAGGRFGLNPTMTQVCMLEEEPEGQE